MIEGILKIRGNLVVCKCLERFKISSFGGNFNKSYKSLKKLLRPKSMNFKDPKIVDFGKESKIIFVSFVCEVIPAILCSCS